MEAADGAVDQSSQHRRDASRRFGVLGPGLPLSIIVLTYCALSVLAFGNVSPWNNQRLPASLLGGWGFGDPAQMTWFLAWTPFALSHGLNLFHSNYLSYPHGVNLAENTLAPLLGLLGAPVTLTLGPIAAFNVLLRLAFASSSLSMYALLRTWVRRPAAFLGGLAFGFGPYMVTQGQTHLDLVFIPLLPLMVWCLYRLGTGRAQHPTRTGALLGLLAGAQFLIDSELLLLFGFTVVVGALVAVVTSPHRFMVLGRSLLSAGIAALGVFVALCGYPMSMMLFARDRLSGPVQPVDVLQSYHSDLAGLVVPTFNQLFNPSKLVAASSAYVGGNLTENVGYWSAPFLGLFILIVVVRRRDVLVRIAGVAAVVAVVMSLGPRLTINTRVSGIPLPEVIFSHLALLNDVVPARFAVVAWLFAILAVVVGAQREWVRPLRDELQHQRFVGAFTIALAVASIVMLWPTTPFVTKSAGFPPDTSSLLSAIPPGASVLVYPYPVIFDTEAQSWAAQSAMRFKLFGGYATYRTSNGAGSPVPPLLAPVAVQEFFDLAKFGHSQYYPALSPRVNVQSALCTFVHRYHVGAIVVWFVGVKPVAVGDLVDRALGRPSRLSQDHTLALWLTQGRSCHSS